MEKNKPVCKVREGNISLAVFNRIAKTKAGKDFQVEDLVLQKGFQKDGKWVNKSITYNKRERAALVRVMNQLETEGGQ